MIELSNTSKANLFIESFMSPACSHVLRFRAKSFFFVKKEKKLSNALLTLLL